MFVFFVVVLLYYLQQVDSQHSPEEVMGGWREGGAARHDHTNLTSQQGSDAEEIMF